MGYIPPPGTLAYKDYLYNLLEEEHKIKIRAEEKRKNIMKWKISFGIISKEEAFIEEI